MFIHQDKNKTTLIYEHAMVIQADNNQRNKHRLSGLCNGKYAAHVQTACQKQPTFSKADSKHDPASVLSRKNYL
jgi:hypothetical protein